MTQTTQQKIDTIRSDKNDFIASSGRYWQHDEGVQATLRFMDEEIARLEKLQSIIG